MSRRTIQLVTAVSSAVTIVIGLILVSTWKHVEKNTYSAWFANTNGLFVGDEIRILGVPVGAIDKIEPKPTATKVTFYVDKQYPVPANVRAAVLSPSLVTARAIQLVPVYSGGPKLAADATIPLERTAVPVEWDDFRKQLDKLTESLQPTAPHGVNTLGHLVNSAADNLRGQGDTARDTVIKLSQAISALGDHATDIFSTVHNLQLLVSALYSSSDLMASFNRNLASVTTILSNSPDEVANAIQGLDGALNDLRSFVGENREGLGAAIDRLSSITTALNDSRGDVKQALHISPSVFQNFLNIYQPAQSAMTGIMAVNNLADPISWICSAIEAAHRRNFEYDSKLCMEYLGPTLKRRNYIPIGINPFTGTMARPNEITYSEDRLRPDHEPPPEGPAPSAEPPALPADAPPADAPPPPGQPPDAHAPPAAPPSARPADPRQGLQGLLIPGAGS